VFFLLPTKKTVQTSDRCHSAKAKKNPKRPEIGKCVCSEKKKKIRFLCRPQAVGEGDERVISLQSRIALVDQFANAPRPLTWGCGWILPLDGRRKGYRMVTDAEV